MVAHLETIADLSRYAGTDDRLVGLTGRPRSIHEDEWVHQTRGMTIHSPALASGELTPGSTDGSLGEELRDDVQMVRNLSYYELL